MASVKDMTRWGINIKTCRTISPEDFEAQVRNGCQPLKGDVLIAKDGATCLDTVCEYKQTEKIVLLSSVAILRPSKLIRSGYLRYYLDCAATRSMLKDGYVSGSAIPRVVLKDFRRAPIPIPPIEVQDRIAGILGALDDKIELNRKMNETLEQMTMALFKSWFVDFDPVHAKAAGRRPAGMDKATADLFPDSFVDSELGKTPKGWTAGSVYEISEVKYGAPFASSLFNSTGTGKPLVRIRDLADESPAVFTTEVHPKGYLLQPGDIAVGMDGEFRAYLWAGIESWLNQRVCVFAPKEGFSAPFVRNSIMGPLSEVESTETATTVIHLGKNDIDRFKVVIPNTEIANAFGHLCQPWYDQIIANKQQSRTLSSLRDSLLPKLLNGESPIKDHQ
jgi:type I restriction enzyme S subunit